VREEAGQSYVFTIEGGKLAKRPVSLGLREPLAGLVEVMSGLEIGAQVVSARMDGLKPGTPAVVIERSPPRSAPPKAG
jgi:hypothetical protein